MYDVRCSDHLGDNVASQQDHVIEDRSWPSWERALYRVFDIQHLLEGYALVLDLGAVGSGPSCTAMLPGTIYRTYNKSIKEEAMVELISMYS